MQFYSYVFLVQETHLAVNLLPAHVHHLDTLQIAIAIIQELLAICRFRDVCLGCFWLGRTTHEALKHQKDKPSINLRQWLPLFRHFWINLQYPLIRARKNLNKAVSFETSLRVPCFPRLNGKNRNRNTRPWSERHILLGSQFIIFTKMAFQNGLNVQFITRGLVVFPWKTSRETISIWDVHVQPCIFAGHFFEVDPHTFEHHLGPGTSPRLDPELPPWWDYHCLQRLKDPEMIGEHSTGWWLNQPIWKIWSSKWIHLP